MTTERKTKASQISSILEEAYKAIDLIYKDSIEENFQIKDGDFELENLMQPLTQQEIEANAENNDLMEMRERAFVLWQHVSGYSVRDNYTID